MQEFFCFVKSQSKPYNNTNKNKLILTPQIRKIISLRILEKTNRYYLSRKKIHANLVIPIQSGSLLIRTV